MLKIKNEDAVLLLIDFQEKLVPAMKNMDEILNIIDKTVKCCKAMAVPIIKTQQYTKGLGETVEALQNELSCNIEIENNTQINDIYSVEKTSFSCCGEPSFMEALNVIGKKTILVAGIEAHVCVQQTVLDLIEFGYDVVLLIDGISSRNNTDKKYATRRMTEAGAIGTTCEAVIFEMCKDAKSPHFKTISKIVK